MGRGDANELLYGAGTAPARESRCQVDYSFKCDGELHWERVSRLYCCGQVRGAEGECCGEPDADTNWEPVGECPKLKLRRVQQGLKTED